ncbi:hypothetical protein METBIDRAFT_32552 [Metschnikowia bicuspidata var. bicuspidata NRRL YB-4993]|uniref:Mitochondrial group I intron splicing factor CCM1 n=1 Tax=Metschnikowia bicuspidata var. bicuspidata NRRL YB-4993 TaxID=869754 RepID=A0A1A0H9L7_9ASCO|nr:hypothetical protein METBIDRAFT_32552 [Metschnikowia bicuspidata var. bicuspidata NRRL YB-4993]OBA20573.1 hypothetical protein METBIDRAFT_32552 [Metschnikowia bicuspidata var. bicuspidata NRRL YB-4993]
MRIVWCRFLSVRAETTQTVSNVKWKLQHYQKTGEFKKFSAKEFKRKSENNRKKLVKVYSRSGVSPQKALILIKSRYDGAIIPDDLGNAINLQALSPNNLRINDPILLQLFKGLTQAKKVERRRIDDRIVMTLTGVTRELIQDSYFVARDVAHLLERDNDIIRAMEVCRLAKSEGSVGINEILDWCLKRSKKELAKKVLVTRGKWGIPLTPATYVTYFSGLSDCHEWGLVSENLAKEVMKQFEGSAIGASIETFNAALKLIIKNYNNDQALAWEFLDLLSVMKLRPDAHTFTIFLQGLRIYYRDSIESIKKDSKILQHQRLQRLFEKEAILILQANSILEKAMILATPPTPPSADEIDKNPESLQHYKKQIRFPSLDIDRHFAVAFLLCYCNPLAGTSWANNSGSHYWYIQQSLAYLQAWIPEIDSMVEFLASSKKSGQEKKYVHLEHMNTLKPNPIIVRKTDARVEKAEISQDFLPQNVAKAKTRKEMNPWLPFPPPPFTNPHHATFRTGIEKQLIDFARVKAGDMHKEFVQYKQSRQRNHRGRAVAIKKKSIHKRDKQSVNKFLLRIFFDCILRLGLYEEFYKAMWLSILTWADIKVDNGKLREFTLLSSKIMSAESYPVIDSLRARNDHIRSSILNALLDVIDIGLVEDFIHKIEEHFPLSHNPTSLVIELLAVFSNRELNKEQKLCPRPATFNAVFSMLNRDMYRYGDRNVAMGYQESRKENLMNNTHKKSMTFSQLNELLDSLDILVRSIFSIYGGSSMESRFLQSYENLVLKIYMSTWDDIPDDHVNSIIIHKKLIRSGILMYRPDHLVDRRENHVYSRLIKKSMNFVHEKLKEKTDLLKDDVDLMMCLRNLATIERHKKNTVSEFEASQMRLYQLTGNPRIDVKAQASQRTKE